MSGESFIVVPWQRPFLPQLLELALERTDGRIGNACFVFPHARPARYMTDLIRAQTRIPKPCLLPRMEPVTALFTLARSALDRAPSMTVGVLDQVALLLHCVRESRDQAARGSLLRDLPLDDSRRFFPWGVRLANLMEDFFQHDRVPEDYIYMEGQVSHFAAALLENLGALHARYMAALDEREWTTPGYDAFKTARALANSRFDSILPGLEGKSLILAGFHTLTGSQEAFFRHLWDKRGALVCLHADAGVAAGSPHWSCVDLVRWADRWRARIQLRGPAPDPEERPLIRFRAGYDTHSQLAELREALDADLKKDAGSGQSSAPGISGTAVVLPDTGLLLPVLHHLPDKNVNVSMGYPLARSPLFRLVESILRMQETRRDGKGPLYHWKAVIEILRHPYLKMLATEPGGAPLRRFLHQAEQLVRAGRRFVDVAELPERTREALEKNDGAGFTPERAREACLQRDLLACIFQAAASAWENIKSPADMAAALESLADLLRERGSSLWERFPIDAECLYRLGLSVIPQLAHTALKEENLPAPTLFAVLRELLNEERVPFEAYPLVGTQILGVLETRLLQFDRLFVLDLTEDRLPGSARHDPLLPDPLRPMAGLPGSHGRERVAAYTFFRLLAGARDVTLFWQEGIEPQGLADGKKIRSRFVEELLWAEEWRRGKLLTPEKPENKGEDGPLRLISCVLPPVPARRASIPVTPAVSERMRRLLLGSISPSSLDSYLHCPARFFYERVGRISQADTVSEGEDPRGTGILLHETLSDFFAPRLGRPISASEAEQKALRRIFLDKLNASELACALPFHDRVILEEAGPANLTAMLRRQEGRIPLHLEEPVEASLSVDGRPRLLAGTVDRVDTYEDELYVLDYKTGSIPKIDGSVWENETLWRALAESPAPGEGGDELLEEIAANFASVQLPAYIYMFGQERGRDVRDALYAPLKAGLEENFLIGPKMGEDERDAVLHEKIPTLLRFLLFHMERAAHFYPREGKNCDWCPYQKMCIVTPPSESE